MSAPKAQALYPARHRGERDFVSKENLLQMSFKLSQASAEVGDSFPARAIVLTSFSTQQEDRGLTAPAASGSEFKCLTDERTTQLAQNACAQRDAPSRCLDFRSVLQTQRAILRRCRHVGIERAIFLCIVEHEPAVVIDKGFRQGTLGEDRMCVQLDMEILDVFDALGLYDGDAVNEVLGLDQHALEMLVFEIHSMLRRDPEIALRHVLIKRAGIDADRQEVFLTHGEASRIGSPANPFDWSGLAGFGHHPVADGEVLHRYRAMIGQNSGPTAVAGDINAVGVDDIHVSGVDGAELCLGKVKRRIGGLNVPTNTSGR